MVLCAYNTVGLTCCCCGWDCCALKLKLVGVLAEKLNGVFASAVLLFVAPNAKAGCFCCGDCKYKSSICNVVCNSKHTTAKTQSN